MSDISYPPNSALQYVNSGNIVTIAVLLANFPPAINNVGMYARVSNLYSAVDDIVRCRWDGQAYRWVPQRDTFNGLIGTTGTVVLTPLLTPPTVVTSGNLTGNITVNALANNAYIGQRFRVMIAGTLGVYTAAITGLVGSNLTLLGNSSRDIEFGVNGWFSVN